MVFAINEFAVRKEIVLREKVKDEGRWAFEDHTEQY